MNGYFQIYLDDTPEGVRKEENMRIVFDFVRFHKKALFLFFICTGIFALVFFLSNIPLDAVLYAGLLSLIAMAAGAGYSFFQFSRHHRDLEKLAETIDAQIDFLPEPRNIIDADYTKIIKELHRQKREFESMAYIEKKELADYFTLWTHQIKTPISAMGLMLQKKGVWAGEDERELAMELFEIEECVNKAMSYIRISEISSDLVFEEFDLDRIVRQAVKKYASIFIQRKISLDFQETRYRVITDKKWLLTVLGQILSNSLKYTPEGGKISIYMEGHRLILSDTGIGIRAEDIPRLFEKGFTGENGRKYSKSTGQGLYLCKTIMDKLSHKILIESREGEGTRVVLDLFREHLAY